MRYEILVEHLHELNVLPMRHTFFCLLLYVCCGHTLYAQHKTIRWNELAHPDTGEIWIRPTQGVDAMPIWGHANGIVVSLEPMPGPRGLIRIYAPYLELRPTETINFIAFEPIPKGKNERGFSELEMSTFDKGQRGKRFWSANEPIYDPQDNRTSPVRGVVGKENGVETLTLYIFSEPFDNGAKVYVRLRFFADRPYEFELTAYKQDDSVDLETYILTATMGNKSRLRNLYLEGSKKTSKDIWPDYVGDWFTPHCVISQREMIHDKHGYAYFIAAPDEKEPAQAIHAEGTASHWRYKGKPATQYWISKSKNPHLQGLVNGRYTYWMSQSPIPGGIAFENVELKEPFSNGLQYVFGISPLTAEEFLDTLTLSR